VVILLAMDMTKMTRVVGPKGQVVIPKQVRDQVGLIEGSEVVVEVRGDEIILRRPSPRTTSYVDFFIETKAPKVRGRVDIRALIEEEHVDRTVVR
jgi:AbrB family looped-hinge helix DNA binding protein